MMTIWYKFCAVSNLNIAAKTRGREKFYLSADFDALEQREKDDEPGDDQRQRQVPHDGTHVVDAETQPKNTTTEQHYQLHRITIIIVTIVITVVVAVLVVVVVVMVVVVVVVMVVVVVVVVVVVMVVVVVVVVIVVIIIIIINNICSLIVSLVLSRSYSVAHVAVYFPNL